MDEFAKKAANPECLKEILFAEGSFSSYRTINEVYPGIFLGNGRGAKDVDNLKKMGVTHILNAAYGWGTYNVDTNEKYYKEKNFKCTFKGIPAKDYQGFKLNIYFDDAADFIESALKNNGKVYVHCYQGISRSATLVIVYLMIKQKMSASEAVKLVQSQRSIRPNEGFIEQICNLDSQLMEKGQS